MARRAAAAVALAAALAGGAAQGATIDAVLLSDIHFDPFDDPTRFERLAAAPAAAWAAILREPRSAGADAARRALLSRCRGEGPATTQALLDSALEEANARAPNARLAIVTGDFFTHGFQCRFEHAAAQATAAGYAAFARKTFDYVAGQVRAAFGGRPVIIALGNHDSGCGNYRQDARDGFVAGVADAVAAAAAPRDPRPIARQFAAGGYFSLKLPEMPRVRLLVLNDIPLSRHFTACDGRPVPAAGQAQLRWLERSLADAAARHEKAWVIGHIPPGIEPWASLRGADVCGREGHVLPLLSDDRLAGVIGRHPEVVRFGVFGHTHMDEFRVLPSARSDDDGIPLKIVPSVTPASGNRPAFVVARIDADGGEWLDYEVFVGSFPGAARIEWSAGYRFSDAYHLPSFSGRSLRFLARQLQRDRAAAESASRAFRDAYSPRPHFAGSSLLFGDRVWPRYACALDRIDTRSFLQCACGGEPPR